MPLSTRRPAHLITTAEIKAIDAIYAAQMALNAADLPLAWGIDATDPFVMLDKVGRAALRKLGYTPRQAAAIWHEMQDNGSGAAWNIALLHDGTLTR